MIMTKCTLYHRCSSFIGPISQLLAAAHCKWTLLSAHAHRMLFGACNTMLCPIYAFRLRTVFGALSNVALPGDLLPEDASLADPSGWPAVVGQLGRLLTVQRQQVEQLTQQLVVSSSSCKQLYTHCSLGSCLQLELARGGIGTASSILSRRHAPSMPAQRSVHSIALPCGRPRSLADGDGDGAMSGSVTSSVAASIGAEPGPVVPSPLVSTTGLTVGSVAFLVPWTSRGKNGGKKGGCRVPKFEWKNVLRRLSPRMAANFKLLAAPFDPFCPPASPCLPTGPRPPTHKHPPCSALCLAQTMCAGCRVRGDARPCKLGSTSHLWACRITDILSPAAIVP